MGFQKRIWTTSKTLVVKIFFRRSEQKFGSQAKQIYYPMYENILVMQKILPDDAGKHTWWWLNNYFKKLSKTKQAFQKHEKNYQ